MKYLNTLTTYVIGNPCSVGGDQLRKSESEGAIRMRSKYNIGSDVQASTLNKVSPINNQIEPL